MTQGCQNLSRAAELGAPVVSRRMMPDGRKARSFNEQVHSISVVSKVKAREVFICAYPTTKKGRTGSRIGRTGGLQADDTEAALGRARLRGQDALDLLPHRQHKAADQVQHAHAHARAAALLRRRLVRVRPHAARSRAVHPVVPAQVPAHVSTCRHVPTGRQCMRMTARAGL